MAKKTGTKGGKKTSKKTGKKTVTVVEKPNVIRETSGMFVRTAREVAKEYPGIETEHLIVDIGMARMANMPELFDVVVVPNLFAILHKVKMPARL